MSNYSNDELCKVILKIVEPRLVALGFDREAINENVNLVDALDSFALLELVLDIEDKAGLDVDLASMDFEGALTVDELAHHILSNK
jgi:acyl carrier protein